MLNILMAHITSFVTSVSRVVVIKLITLININLFKYTTENERDVENVCTVVSLTPRTSHILSARFNFKGVL